MDNPNYYAIIPANVRYDKKLRANEKLLYGEITALAQKDGICWATNEYFAKLYDVRKEQVSRWIANLVECNYLKSELIYKEGTLQIIGRYLSIIVNSTNNDVLPPIAQKDTYCAKTHDGHDKKRNTPIAQKRKDNSTSKEQYKMNISTPLPPKGGFLEKQKDEIDFNEQIDSNLITKTKRATINSERLFNYDGFDNDEQQAIKEWFIYRNIIRKPYKDKFILTKFRSDLLAIKASNNLVAAINHSIARQYNGIYPPNWARGNNSPPKKSFNDFTINQSTVPVCNF